MAVGRLLCVRSFSRCPWLFHRQYNPANICRGLKWFLKSIKSPILGRYRAISPVRPLSKFLRALTCAGRDSWCRWNGYSLQACPSSCSEVCTFWWTSTGQQSGFCSSWVSKWSWQTLQPLCVDLPWFTPGKCVVFCWTLYAWSSGSETCLAATLLFCHVSQGSWAAMWVLLINQSSLFLWLNDWDYVTRCLAHQHQLSAAAFFGKQTAENSSPT